MEPTLMVVGVNYRTAPVAVRERFWIGEDRRDEVLSELFRTEGIEEVIVLATCNRTEFLLWANDAGVAAGSVLHFLTSDYGLKLCEWKYFYRLLDEDALLHIFRVASSMDSMVIGEPQIISQVKSAWQQARKMGTSGRFLDAVMQKALTVSKRVRTETAVGRAAVSVPSAAVETAKQLFGSLENRQVLLLGAGKMSGLSARYLMNNGATGIRVINRTMEHAAALASQLGGVPVPFEERWQSLIHADIVISSTSCPHTILNREEAEFIARERKGRPLCLIDIAVPRDIDPAVRKVVGMVLYDIDDLQKVIQHNTGEREAAAAQAQNLIAGEVRDFRRKLLAEHMVPTIIALRDRLDEICRQELDCFGRKYGPFSAEQERLVTSVASSITQRIAGSLARELKELHEATDQERTTAVLQKLFHLASPEHSLSQSAVAEAAAKLS